LTMHSGFKGLSVKIYLWPIGTNDLSSEAARLWIKGEITHGDTKKVEKFNDAGQLLSILGKWNVAKYQYRKRQKRLARRS
jgi:hypothetical protein